jgi:hypothetical protein
LSEAKRISESIEKSPDKFRNYYVPVFKQRCDGTPYHSGTAFGFEHHGRRRLLTALHVLDKDQENACDTQDELYLFVGGILQSIGRFNKEVVYEHGLPKRAFDLVMIEPLDFSLSQVLLHFFTVDDLYLRRLHPDLYVAACGFPSGKNRASWRNKPLKNRPYGYIGRVSPSWKTRLAGFSTHSHFGIDIFLKKTFTRTRREISAPKPHGISGGPVLVLHDFRKPRSRPRPLLRGLVIEKGHAQRCIICIDLRKLRYVCREPASRLTVVCQDSFAARQTLVAGPPRPRRSAAAPSERAASCGA